MAARSPAAGAATPAAGGAGAGSRAGAGGAGAVSASPAAGGAGTAPKPAAGGAGAGSGAAFAGAGTAALAVAGAGAASGAGGKQENVKVAIRVRPFNRREKELKAASIVEIVGGRSITITDPSKADKPAEAQKKFAFDFVYGWDTRQETVYVDLGRPIVDQSINGFNGTIFAYGQTGSGKTFSMMGDDDRKYPGIIPQMNIDLFARVEAAQKADPARQWLIIVSYLEIYNEVVKDLLNPSDKQLMIREHPEMGIYVQDLAELVVKSADDVVRLIEQGQKVRHVASTNMNERSSRSHSCFTIKIEQKTVEELGDKQKTTTLTSKINLVDLAGSERASKTGATGDVLKQGAAINKSLSALGNVINALAEGGKGHIPYRDSKLTRLLQHSLGGNSLTVMVAAVSPADDNFEETLSTLQYANRAKNIKNDAKRNEDVNELLIRQLREEIESLRKALAAAQTGGAGATGEGGLSDAQKAMMEEMIANLERAKQQSWDEKQRLSMAFEEERMRNLENENKIRSVMKTLKEDNMEIVKRVKQLDAERVKLTKRFNTLREDHIQTRKALAEAMAEYQELYADGGEDGPHKEELEKILEEVEALHEQVEKEAAEVKQLRQLLDENDAAQTEARAEAAAQRMLLEEDMELRKAIQEEERAKLERENEVLLAKRLDEERAKLRADADREREALMAKMASEKASEHEQELELKLIAANSERAMLVLEIAQLKSKHEAEVARIEQEHRKEVHALKVEELRMFREMCDGVEDEKKELEGKLSETSAMLQQAVQDLMYLTARNAELEKQLIAAAAWEPPATA